MSTVIWVVARYSNYVRSGVPASGSINNMERSDFEVNSGDSNFSH